MSTLRCWGGAAPLRPATVRHKGTIADRGRWPLTLSGGTLFRGFIPTLPRTNRSRLSLSAPRGRTAAGRPVAPRQGIGAGEDVGGAYRCGDRQAGRDGVSGRAAQTRAAVRADGQVRYDIGKGVGVGLVDRERRPQTLTNASKPSYGSGGEPHGDLADHPRLPGSVSSSAIDERIGGRPSRTSARA